MRNTPISEAAIVGATIGASLTGLRPIVEIMFCDFLYVAMDQIVTRMAKMKYMYGGDAQLPIVIRCTCGGGFSAAAQHSQSNEAMFMHVPGLKIVMPSRRTTPRDCCSPPTRTPTQFSFSSIRGCMTRKERSPARPCRSARRA